MDSTHQTISYYTLATYPSVPPQFSGVVDQGTWQELRIAEASATANSHSTACVGELCCCFLTGFWCIFCFHPVFASNLKESQLQREIQNINYTRFNGRQVFTVVSNEGILVDTSYIPSQPQVRGAYTTEAMVVPVYSQPPLASESSFGVRSAVVEAYAIPITGSSQTVHAPSNNPGLVVASIVDTSAHADRAAVPTQASTVRHMTITLPENVYPYANLRVVSPEGLQVSVDLPRDVQPGKQIKIRY